MGIRSAHGRAAELGHVVVVEGSPADELPAGTPACSGPVDRRSDGTVTAAGARELGRRGGERAAERRRFAAQLADQLGLAEVGGALAPYIDAAREFAQAHLASLAATVGGGTVGPAPASAVQSAALALAASRYAYAEGSRTGDVRMLGQGARLADQSRASLLTAHELAAREAKARPRQPTDVPWLRPERPSEPRSGGDDSQVVRGSTPTRAPEQDAARRQSAGAGASVLEEDDS